MSLYDFVAANRAELDRQIEIHRNQGRARNNPILPVSKDDDLRQKWVLNCWELCEWARREGVRV